MWTQRAVGRIERIRWPETAQASAAVYVRDWPAFDQAATRSVLWATRTGARGVDHEAHVPAESTSAREEPWFPGPNANPRWPLNFGRTAWQGSHPTFCLTMLPAHHRLRASRDFVHVLRAGRRGSSATVVVHALRQSDAKTQPRIGFAVSRAVGNSVVRHRVARRLRALIGPHLERLPPGTSIVVRALPKAAAATNDELSADLEQALTSAGVW